MFVKIGGNPLVGEPEPLGRGRPRKKRRPVDLHLRVEGEIVEYARSLGMNLSEEFEAFLSYRLGVNSPADEIRAEIARCEAKLSALRANLERAEAPGRAKPEMEYWRRIYGDLGKGAWSEPQRKRWIDRVAKMLKIEPKELEKELEAK